MTNTTSQENKPKRLSWTFPQKSETYSNSTESQEQLIMKGNQSKIVDPRHNSDGGAGTMGDMSPTSTEMKRSSLERSEWEKMTQGRHSDDVCGKLKKR
jgi:hypothetical protein